MCPEYITHQEAQFGDTDFSTGQLPQPNNTRRLSITNTEVVFSPGPEAADIYVDKQNFKIAVLQGGFEPERVPSILNGGNIALALSDSGYAQVSQVDVDYSIIDRLQEIEPDFGFVSMFCKWGEDGVLQSLLEIMRIPYSGCGVEASAICKDKFAFSMFAKSLGIDVPDTRMFETYEELLDNTGELKYPCIVKPAYQGYSLGITNVTQAQDLEAAAKEAFLFSTRVVVQDFIDGKEFTIGVLDIPDRGPVVLPIIELKLKRPIQSVEVKEGKGLVEEIIPAEMTEEEQNTLEALTIKLYKALGCSGVSRFDVRQESSSGKFFFLENNTSPGLISLLDSDLPKQLHAAGIPLEQYVDYMIISGLTRPQTKLEYQFE
jgi:D-alanine-D-alanine ligase